MISIIAPFYNEARSVKELHQRIVEVMRRLGQPFEVLFVDDGSTDRTFEEIKKCAPVRAFRLSLNSGQTIAFGCGIKHSRGETIVTLDGDLENRPEDIPHLLQKLSEGYDVVAGWREDRWSRQFFTRRLPSLLANHLISRVTRVKLHDHGCNLRAYRRGVFQNVSFVGEMHRMLAAYLGMRGAKIAEIQVSYQPRRFGRSKYGLSRTFRVLLDILAFHFFRKYFSRPMHFFGYLGFLGIFLGFVTFLGALYLRVFSGVHFNRTPLPELVAILTVVGFQFILMGLLGEILVRGRSRGVLESEYDIRERIERR